MAAVSGAFGHIVNRTKQKAEGFADQVANPVETKEDAPEGERLRVLGYLIGERRSSGITLVKVSGSNI